MSEDAHSFGTPDDRFKPASFTPPPPPGAPPPGEPPSGPPPPPGAPPKAGVNDGVLRGFLIGLLTHSLQIVLGAVTAGVSVFAIGLSQLLYLLPLAIYFRKQGMPLTAKGMFICLGVTFLLNAACFGILIIALMNADFR